MLVRQYCHHFYSMLHQPETMKELIVNIICKNLKKFGMFTYVIQKSQSQSMHWA